MNAAADTDHLLQEFAERRSESAFADLVRRHLNLVYSAALRRCGGQTGLAEETCQLVFVDLAQQAKRLRAGAPLAGWLYQHACFVASNLVRAESRRQLRERTAMHLQTLADETDWSRLAPVLDDVLLELPPADRDPLVLRFLDQQPYAEVGQRLGLTEGAARMRVERALDKLRAKLAQRGVTSTASALALALAGPAVTAAPSAMVATVTASALASAVTSTSTLGLFTLMTTPTLKTVAVTVAAGAVGTLLLLQQRTLHRLDAENVGLQRQVAEWTQAAEVARAESARVAEELARREMAAAELLRLRGEVTELRQQLAAASSARVAVPPPAAPSEAEALEAAKAFGLRRLNESKQMVLGLILFAGEHNDRFPDSLELAANRAVNEGVVPSLEDLPIQDFELVYTGSLREIANPSEAIVLREREAWRRPNGGWARTYGFADGHSEIKHSDDGDYAEFEAKRQVRSASGGPVSSTGK
ncbi:MAG: sigma-70 family RNA polymerase sigma factor [Verrucomicrobia bacterium]|nr:sigma-70 family RNA polymerase sigma factor [Verrucomicrobiota bacterium]